jgi:hypothetical protein
VHDSRGVRAGQPIGNLDGNGEDLQEIQGAFAHFLAQVGPFHVLVDNERQVVHGFKVVHGGDHRMVESRGSSGLGFQASAQGPVRGQLGNQHLERHRPAQAHIMGPIDYTHASLT